MQRSHSTTPSQQHSSDHNSNNYSNSTSATINFSSMTQQQQHRQSPQHQYMNMQSHHHHHHQHSITPSTQQQPPPMIMMERLLYNLHYKCCTYALQTTSRKSRFYAEHTILIIAICCFGALLLSHRTFVFYPSSIYFNKSTQNYTTNHHQNQNQYHHHHHHYSIHHHHRHYIPTQCLKSIPGFIADTNQIDVTHLILINDDDDDSDVTALRRSKDHSYTVIHNPNRDYRNPPSVAPHSTCSSSSSSSSSMDTNEEECSSIEAERTTISSTSSSILRKNDRIMFSYAREKGYLFLSSSSSLSNTQMLLPISTQYVYVSKHDSLCFGEPFVQYLIFHLLYYILGPDTVMINWILGTFYLPSNSNHITNHLNPNMDSYTTTSTSTTTTHHHSGYIYNPRTSVVIDIEEYKQQQTHYGNSNHDNNNKNHWWIKRKLYELGLKFLIVIKTSFLFFITTTLVSFTLRETQGRMLQFTHTLQQQCLLSPTTQQQPVNPNQTNDHTSTTAANTNSDPHSNMNTPPQHQLNYNVIVQLIMTHVLENVIFVPIIVGFIYFLINFYNGDKFLAFMVLTLVWVCESFSMVSLRTGQGMQYFPLFFYFLFALFHYYHISFPYGFSYAALTTSMCFMMHSMLFFWHRYELPAVFLGRVNPDHFRAGGGYNNNNNNTPIPSPPMARVLPSMNDRQNVLDDETVRWQDMSSPVASPPPAPLPNLERLHFGRTHSFTTFAPGRLSRNSSNNGMYNRGDEDDEGSYMYFMGGEVVIPRHQNDHSSNGTSDNSRQRATSPHNTASEYVPSPTNPTLRVESTSSSLSLSSDTAVPGPASNSESSRLRRERFVNELEPVVASAISMDDESELHRTYDVTPDSASQGSGNPTTNLLDEHIIGDDPYLGENNSSALQVILSALEDIDATSTHSQNRNDTTGIVDGGSSAHDQSIFR